MDANRFVNRIAPSGLLLGMAIFSGAILLSCNQGEAKAENVVEKSSAALELPPKSPSDSESTVVEPSSAEARSEYKEAAFSVMLKAPAQVKAGAPLDFVIVLSAHDGFKINEEYPLKFQFNEAKGVTPKKDIVRKEDAQVEKSTATLPLTVTIGAAGKHTVSGKLSFSVCTEERCLIEKRDLKVEVDAS